MSLLFFCRRKETQSRKKMYLCKVGKVPLWMAFLLKHFHYPYWQTLRFSHLSTWLTFASWVLKKKQKEKNIKFPIKLRKN